MRINALVISAALAVSSVSCFVPSQPLARHYSTEIAAAPSKNEKNDKQQKQKANPVIKIAAQGMSLLKPVFQLEAQLQAAVLGATTDKDQVAQEIADIIKANKIVIYTYAVSPFSTEAVAVLDAAGYDYLKIELGLEWFALGGKGSETRVALSRLVETGATSLPKIFIGGTCIGGYAELAALVDSGELEVVMKKAGAKKKGQKGKAFAGLSFMK